MWYVFGIGRRDHYSDVSSALLPSNVIQRAFELSDEGHELEEIRTRLKREGYLQVDAHLNGPKIKSDLRKRLDTDRVRKRPLSTQSRH